MENFKDAAKRHYDDAEYLNSDRRVANAGQLYGLAAECCIKAVLSGVTGTFPKKHLDNDLLNNCFINQLSMSVDGRASQNYYAIIPNIQDFASWQISHRYWEDSAIPNDIGKWQAAAKEAISMLDRAIVDGVVT